MESCTIAVTSHDYADARRVLSECWIFTPERGLRAMTLHGNGSTLAIDGRRLIRWCILDDAVPRSILAYLYSAEHPSAELRNEVAGLARERFVKRQSIAIGPQLSGSERSADESTAGCRLAGPSGSCPPTD